MSGLTKASPFTLDRTYRLSGSASCRPNQHLLCILSNCTGQHLPIPYLKGEQSCCIGEWRLIIYWSAIVILPAVLETLHSHCSLQNVITIDELYWKASTKSYMYQLKHLKRFLLWHELLAILK